MLPYLLATEVGGEAAARIAGVLSAVYVPAIHLCTVWASETLFIPCFALAVRLFLVYFRTGSYGVLGLGGLLLGWSVLVRPFSLLCIPLLMGFLLVKAAKPTLACCVLLVSSLASARVDLDLKELRCAPCVRS